ncbi:acetyl-CoA carboxylase biotin carboxyl carrier protein [Herbiconiux ginsengi]|uniref:Biotin carboxyl carrier protein of acetyl-CoA carboxylase n=1 Tax=Herbiconiux ginsengi TaxID=381665 RepID=A0A1H3NFL1_9MICO|nr:acetyl-CoA carboxylase biotin carboxyl carrier protein [Herbiconiux ginsengi]SDY87245.1 biotin carboxyl carrier protein [Herbiconiux ginsengi]
MPLNPPDIKELRALVDWVNLTDDVRELSITYGDVELFISRDRRPAGGGAAPVTAVAAAPPAPAAAPVPAVPAPVSAPVAAAPAAVPGPAPTRGGAFSAETLAADDVLITAPMVGVFYASPKPGDPAFVAVGDAVAADTVLCIVEVMKLMSNIEAGVEGTVTQILVENEQAVEYGQPLMVITRHG